MGLQKLPIGIQTFSEIRSDDYVYIDKTNIAYEILEKYKYIFLSRPRRFGKSLFLDTLKNIFEAKKEYFKGLAIEDKWDWSVSYPVIKIIMNDEFLILNDLKDMVSDQLLIQAREYKIELEKDEPYFMLSRLLRELHQKFDKRVVLLIDDADKPFRDKLLDDNVKEIHYFLLGLYIVTKNSDEHIKFSMMTGIYPIKGDYFFGFNNFTDISLDEPYGDICGYSQNDLETTFKPHLKDVDMEKLKRWYNGYNFLASSMYNPFDILQFITKGFKYKNYWFETGTPTFLMKLIKKENYFLPNLANLVVGEELLNSFDIENIKLEVILYQAGYLTIDKMIEKRRGGIEYKLKIPNLEVKFSFFDFIINYITNIESTKKITTQDNIYDVLLDLDMQNFKTSLISIFASIPYNNYTKNHMANYEGFYASVLYVYLQSLGLDIIGEDITNKGKIDLTIKMDHAIFILEFKVDGKKGDGLKQIKDKKYHEKYLLENKDIYLIGIEFNSEDRNISEVEWEKL